MTHLDNQITVSSVSKLPVDGESERIVAGIKITGDATYVDESIFNLFRSTAQVTEYKGVRILIKSSGETGDEDEFEEFSDPSLKGENGDIEEKVFAVKDGYVFLSNNVEQIHSIIDTLDDNSGGELAQAADYVRISKALESLAGDKPPSFRQFNRLDRMFRANFEMMRAGQMASAKTLLARLLNLAYEADEKFDEDQPREQQIDGSKLPEDYEGQVAKYFGLCGSVIHTVDNGWVVTGCLLPRQAEDTLNTSTEQSTSDDQ